MSLLEVNGVTHTYATGTGATGAARHQPGDR